MPDADQHTERGERHRHRRIERGQDPVRQEPQAVGPERAAQQDDQRAGIGAGPKSGDEPRAGRSPARLTFHHRSSAVTWRLVPLVNATISGIVACRAERLPHLGGSRRIDAVYAGNHIAGTEAAAIAGRNPGRRERLRRRVPRNARSVRPRAAESAGAAARTTIGTSRCHPRSRTPTVSGLVDTEAGDLHVPVVGGPSATPLTASITSPALSASAAGPRGSTHVTTSPLVAPVAFEMPA